MSHLKQVEIVPKILKNSKIKQDFKYKTYVFVDHL